MSDVRLDEAGDRSTGGYAVTLTELLALDPRERDARVAELVMGWRDIAPREIRGYGCPDQVMLFGVAPDDPLSNLVPHYSTDIAADYVVLEKVRADWGEERIAVFASCLRDVWDTRPSACRLICNGGDLPLAYRAGDYALAALASLDT